MAQACTESHCKKHRLAKEFERPDILVITSGEREVGRGKIGMGIRRYKLRCRK